MASSIFADIVCADAIKPQSTLIIDDNGIIKEMYPGRKGRVTHDFSHYLLLPGFVDVHVHGAGGADFMDGTVDAVRTVLRTHARYGTTTVLATTITSARENVDQCLRSIKAVMNSPGIDEARIAGVHLEGPYICRVKRGAQPLVPIRPPDVDELAHWIELSGNTIKLITLAPETAFDGGKQFIEFARSKGIIVSIGHTSSTYEQANFAIKIGASHATHLFNAMPTLHHREPGAVGALLESDRVYVELIADGVHVHPAILKMVTHAVGTDRVILITDAMSGAAMPDGIYSLGGQEVVVKNAAAKFHDGTLAGSVLTLNQAFSNIQKFANVSVLHAAKMTSGNASRQLGIDSSTGTISPGKVADLVLIDPATNFVKATMSCGRWIWLDSD